MPQIKDLESLVQHQIFEEVKVLHERRFGQKYTSFRYDRLSRDEQEWLVHNAGVNVQKERRRV